MTTIIDRVPIMSGSMSSIHLHRCNDNEYWSIVHHEWNIQSPMEATIMDVMTMINDWTPWTLCQWSLVKYLLWVGECHWWSYNHEFDDKDQWSGACNFVLEYFQWRWLIKEMIINLMTLMDLHVLPSLIPKGEICSGYPSSVYDCNWLSLPILRQKQAQVLW